MTDRILCVSIHESTKKKTSIILYRLSFILLPQPARSPSTTMVVLCYILGFSSLSTLWHNHLIHQQTRTSSIESIYIDALSTLRVKPI